MAPGLHAILMDAIWQRLESLKWHRYQTAQSLQISVRCLRNWVHRMRHAGYEIKANPDYKNNKSKIIWHCCKDCPVVSLNGQEEINEKES